MRSVPDSITTDAGPPLALPLAHFLVGLAFLAVGALVATSLALGAGPPFARLVAVHLLLVGWIALTIMGAMIQFVPVWSGVELFDRRLAIAQLVLVGSGVPGFAVAFLLARPAVAVGFAGIMVLGMLCFCLLLALTLNRARPWDSTETHFALAIAFLFVATLLGFGAALEFRFDLFPIGPVGRPAVIGAHATLAVFGGLVVTIVGALYQLGPMFTQHEPGPAAERLRRLELVVMPAGVVVLALGRLVGVPAVGRVGAAGVVLGMAIAFCLLLTHVRGATTGYSPMLPRYLAAGVLGVAWAATASIGWASDPLSYSAWFGMPGIGPALLFGAIGFVVVGTLYHVIPFLIWLRGYSDLVGFEPVPMTDDLYHDGLARAELVTLLSGTGVLIVGITLPVVIPPWISAGLLLVGIGLFVTNMGWTVRIHAPSAIAVDRLRVSDRGG